MVEGIVCRNLTATECIADPAFSFSEYWRFRRDSNAAQCICMLFRTPEALGSTTVVATRGCNKPWSVGLEKAGPTICQIQAEAGACLLSTSRRFLSSRESSRGLGRLFSATMGRTGIDLEAGRSQVRVILRIRGAWGPGCGSGVDGCAGLRVRTGTR